MCDYSLQAFKSRPAVAGEDLTVHNFGSGTTGFIGGDEGTAVCVLPGTELAFEKNVVASNPWHREIDNQTTEYGNVAVFDQVEKGNPYAHHDALRFPNGDMVKLTLLVAGQKAKILQLPAAPKTAEEEEAQRRVAVVG